MRLRGLCACITVLRISCRDTEQTKKLFEKYKPTHVIHLAALGRRPLFACSRSRLNADAIQ